MPMILDRAASEMQEMFPTLPWKIRLSYQGQSRTFGSGSERVEIACKTERPLRELIGGDLPAFLDRYVDGEADFNGDIYAIVGVRRYIRQQTEWMVGLWLRAKYELTHMIPSSVRKKLLAVSSHYDLPTQFFESYLDTRCRAYSCAIWNDPLNVAFPEDESLEDAQHRKHTIAAENLDLQRGDKLLDIGCGYGYMVRLAETQFGCDALGITLSQKQIDDGYSKNLKLLHYWELKPEGQFDKIYTCGMISHLDRAEIERFYRQTYGLLRSGGKVWFHAIVPPANDYGMTNYNSLSGTFSQKYVFPDHFQFPIHVHLKVMERAGFKVQKIFYRYGHYGKTLRHWYKRYVENLPKTRHMITPTIERAWHLYLTYASEFDGPESVLKQFLCTKA